MSTLDGIVPTYNRAEGQERVLEQVVWMILRKKAGEEASKASSNLRDIRAFVSGFPGAASNKRPAIVDVDGILRNRKSSTGG